MNPFENIVCSTIPCDSTKFYNVGIDPVIASVTSYRLRGEGKFVDASEKAILTHITDSDREEARQIREYYESKLTMQAMRGIPLRSFRQDLLVYLTSNNALVTHETFPMIYRLPEFFREDRIFEQVSKQATNGWKKGEPALAPPKETHSLQYLDTHVRLTNQSKTRIFWFKRVSDDRLVKIAIDLRNPLLNLFVEYINKHAIITLVGKYVCLSLDGQDFYKVDNWKLEI